MLLLLSACCMANIIETRYKASVCMSDGKGKDLLARLKKKINCASLPPCAKTLLSHIRRASENMEKS